MFICKLKVNFFSNFFFEILKRHCKLAILETLEMVDHPIKIVVSICSKLPCLSACKKSNSLLTFLLKVKLLKMVKFFLFCRKFLFCSQDVQVFVFSTIQWFTKSVTSWWVLVHGTGLIWNNKSCQDSSISFFVKKNKGQSKMVNLNH